MSTAEKPESAELWRAFGQPEEDITPNANYEGTVRDVATASLPEPTSEAFGDGSRLLTVWGWGKEAAVAVWVAARDEVLAEG